MIMVIAKWENGWFDQKTEVNMWLQTMKAYNIEKLVMTPIREDTGHAEQFLTMEEALDAYPDIKKVFLEPIKNRSLTDHEFISLVDYSHPVDCVYIFGNSGSGNAELAKQEDDIVYIPTPQEVDLFGSVAFGIAMYDRSLKNVS